ncbi:MAG: dihydrolipoyl dehydrogenase [Acidobacteriota bacterium]
MPAPSLSTDLAVVGAGPGGYAAAFLAADLGMEVTLIDPAPAPGGVCLHRGCVPSKTLLHLVRLLHEVRQARQWGLKFGEPQIDLARLRAFKEEVITRLSSGLMALEKKRGVATVQARARFQDGSHLLLAESDGTTHSLSFEKAIIATGSRPVSLSLLPDSDRILDSTTALELRGLPARLLIIGGGYIGLELGSVYAALGSRVTVVETTGSLLAGIDADLVRPLEKQLRRDFQAIHLETSVRSARQGEQGLLVELAGAQAPADEVCFDAVLTAVGRRPASGDLGLENTGVTCDRDGFVKVDAGRQTAEPSIFAIGDITGQPMLAHKASHEARAAVLTMTGRQEPFRPRAIPAVVFTDPEIAWCGLTEMEARRLKQEVDVARFPWAASGRAQTLDRSEGLTKLVVDPGSQRILGVGLTGPGAGELIAQGVLAIEMGATAEDLALTIHPHPTLSETLMEAADIVTGRSTHFIRPGQR